MKRFVALILAVLMVFSLAACGKKDEAKAPENAAPAAGPDNQSTPAPVVPMDQVNKTDAEANVAPDQINLGVSGAEAHVGDAWYLDGDKTKDYIYFEAADNAESGLAYVKMVGGERAETILCAVTAENHLVDQDAEDGKSSIDIVFHDDFKAYDHVSGQWFVRGDPEVLGQIFVGVQFKCQDNETNTLIFNADGTGLEVFEGEEDEISWLMDSASTVKYNDGDYDYVLEIVTDENGKLVSLNEQNLRIFVPAA